MKGLSIVWGPSGAGKSTFLKVLSGLEIGQGSLLFGQEIWQQGEVGLPTYKRSMGYVFQDGYLFPHMNVLRNIDYVTQRTKSLHSKEQKEFWISELDLKPLLLKKTTELSGGERQRVALALALVRQPRWLLFDEPLNAVDEPLRYRLLDLIRNYCRQHSVPILYVTHSRKEALLFGDYFVQINNGTVTWTGSYTELLSSPEDFPLFKTDKFSILPSTLKEHDHHSKVSLWNFPGGTLYCPLSQSMRNEKSTRLLIAAKDVSVTRHRPEESSILNILSSEIDSIIPHGTDHYFLKLKIGTSFLLAQITYKSLKTLQLEVGERVYAQIKGVALLT